MFAIVVEMSESTKRSLLSYFKVEPKRLKTSGDEDDLQEVTIFTTQKFTKKL